MQRDLFTLPTGLEIGHARAKEAADHAGDEWQRMAYEAFLAYAKTHKHFTTEEVREANLDLPPPPDKRAWGQIALLAKRNQKVIGASFTRAKSRTVHGMVVTLWASQIYEGI
jgi:hypothetical protein